MAYKGTPKVPQFYCTDELFFKTNDNLGGECFRACTKVIDLNNEENLKANCEELTGFNRIIDEIELGISSGIERNMTTQKAVENGVDAGILSSFLKVHATEVNSMLVTQYDRA